MLSALLKKQLQEIFRSYFYNAKQGKARSRASTLGYFAFFAVLMVGVLGGMFTYLAHSLCAPFAAAGMEWLYFHDHGHGRHRARCIRQRIQHLFEPLSCQG